MFEYEILSIQRTDEVFKIETECFGGEGWSRRMIEDEIDNENTAFILRIDRDTDRVVAYGCILMTLGAYEITNIAVDPLWRRQGHGEKMLKRLVKYCTVNKAEKIFLEVKDSNTAARNLYKKFGFTETGLRPRYYKDGSDAVLMTKLL